MTEPIKQVHVGGCNDRCGGGTHYLLSALPEPEYGRLGRGIRWALLFSAFAWFLILMAGFLVARGGAP